MPNTITTDPAWFYSSLAQTSAAIIGLIGAILITRVIDQIVVKRTERRALDISIHSAWANLNEKIQFFTLFKSYLEKEIGDDEMAIKKNIPRSIQQWMSWGSSGGGLETISIENLPSHLSEREKDLAAIKILAPIYSKLSGKMKMVELIKSYENHPDLFDKLNYNQRAKVWHTNSIAMLKNLQKNILQFKSNLIPTSFVIVVILLCWLGLVGIIWPLSSLPGLSNSFYSKDYMLTAFSIGLLGLFGYFIYQFYELWKLGELNWPEAD